MHRKHFSYSIFSSGEEAYMGVRKAGYLDLLYNSPVSCRRTSLPLLSELYIGLLWCLNKIKK